MRQFKREYKWLLFIAILSFGVYLNALGGEFVYDDKRQILMNTLIQEPSLYGKALTSEVWAFKGDGTVAASNYYRPTFVAWLIINFGLFGANPFGWHLTNILLHTTVCLLAYLLLRKFQTTRGVAFAITAIFAVHPVHSESVAWITGSPDLLFGVFFLSSLLFALKARGSPVFSWQLMLAAAFYFLALGSKEIGFAGMPLYFLVVREGGSENARERNRKALARCVPFAAVALIFFIVRQAILGGFAHPVEDSVSLAHTLLTIPSLVVFYTRQLVFPVWLAVNHPLRPAIGVGLESFILPLFLMVAIIAALWFAARREIVGVLGFALFFLTLIPAFNLTAFPAEQIVHDRYLYLAALGFLMVVVTFATRSIQKFVPSWKYASTAISLIVVILLGIATIANNRVWANDLGLWQHTSHIDPESAFTYSQLGASLFDAGRIDESIKAYDRSLAIRPTPNAYLGRGLDNAAIGDNQNAEANARIVIDTPLQDIDAYTLYRGYGLLAVALSNEKRFADAERYLRTARTVLPIYSAALTEKLAVVLYNENRKQDALFELESVRNQATRELLPDSKYVFLRLGMLYAEIGNKQAAASELNEFLRATANASNADTKNDRRQAAEQLRRVQ